MAPITNNQMHTVTTDRVYIASRRRRRERFLGLIRQIKFGPGMSYQSLVCQGDEYDHQLADIKPKKATAGQLPPLLFSSDYNNNAICSIEARGHLLYEPDSSLSVCDGTGWLAINNRQQRLRHFEDYDDIYAHSKTFDIETFTIDNEGHYFGRNFLIN